MIALNELLLNIEEYTLRYKQKGVRFNPKFFVKKEEQRKKLQLETEKMRADCNKLCTETISKHIQTKSETMTEIDSLNEKIQKNDKVLTRYNNQINAKLSKLHNLPENVSFFNEQISTTGKSISLDIVKKYLATIGKNEKVTLSEIEFYKSIEDRLFVEEELPAVYFLDSCVMILSTKQQMPEISTGVINFFKENALSTIKLSVKKLSKESAAEYFVHLNKNEFLKVRFATEFNSREYNVKYRDKSIDMTKFVNQIIIKLK